MLPDILDSSSKIIFVGTAVGKRSAQLKHYYSHPNNRFWQLLESTGLTCSANLGPEEDKRVLDYGLGISDLVKSRATSSDADLRESDFDVESLLERIGAAEPLILASNGAKAAKAIADHLGRGNPKEGPVRLGASLPLLYQLPSSSGANAMYYNDKLAEWQAFGEFAARLLMEDQRGRS